MLLAISTLPPSMAVVQDVLYVAVGIDAESDASQRARCWITIHWQARKLREEIKARWQSGYAADCNSVYAGSIPTRASI